MTSKASVEELAREAYPSPNHPTGYAFKTSQVVEMERKAFIAGYNKASEQDKWIDIKEQEPKSGIVLLVCNNIDKWYSTAKYVHKRFLADDACQFILRATHWKYLKLP